MSIEVRKPDTYLNISHRPPRLPAQLRLHFRQRHWDSLVWDHVSRKFHLFHSNTDLFNDTANSFSCNHCRTLDTRISCSAWELEYIKTLSRQNTTPWSRNSWRISFIMFWKVQGAWPPERYNGVFNQPITCAKRCFALFNFSHMDLVIDILEIKFREDYCPTDYIPQLRHYWNGRLVLSSNFVEGAIVNAWLQFSIWYRHKFNGRACRWLADTYFPNGNHFVQILLQNFGLLLRKAVNWIPGGGFPWFEVDPVVEPTVRCEGSC